MDTTQRKLLRMHWSVNLAWLVMVWVEMMSLLQPRFQRLYGVVDDDASELRGQWCWQNGWVRVFVAAFPLLQRTYLPQELLHVWHAKLALLASVIACIFYAWPTYVANEPATAALMVCYGRLVDLAIRGSSSRKHQPSETKREIVALGLVLTPFFYLVSTSNGGRSGPP